MTVDGDAYAARDASKAQSFSRTLQLARRLSQDVGGWSASSAVVLDGALQRALALDQCISASLQGLQVDARYGLNTAPRPLSGSRRVDVKGEASRLTLSILL